MKDEKIREMTNELKQIFDKYSFHVTPQIFNNELNCFMRTKKLQIPYFYNIVHFSSVSGFSQKQLLFFIDNIEKTYVTFNIEKKSGGVRTINAPSKQLKTIQRWILDNILYHLEIGENVYGFIPKKSIVDNAKLHINHDLVCGIDIKDFFPSITRNRVWGFFKSIGYNNIMTGNFTELTTFEGRLPQGAPTSPMIANLICRRMDKRLNNFCKKHLFQYTRYADDITISGHNSLPSYMTLITRIIKDEGFEINSEKTRMIGRGSAQKVTGIYVNDFLSLGRNEKRRLKAITYNINKNGPIKENKEDDPFFREKIFGKVSFLKMINPALGHPLLETLKKVDWDGYNEYYSDAIKREMRERDLRKTFKNRIIKFDELGFFKEISKLPKLTDEDVDGLIAELKQLKEKCNNHGKEACQNCLIKPKNKKYQKCMKYILGQYVSETGSHHHGHELFDIGNETELFKNIVFVIFLLKSSPINTVKANSLFTELFDCLELNDVDVISTVTPEDLSSKLKYRIKSAANKHPEKDLCFIMREEMLRIYIDYKRKMNNK